jgi:hypothetical protein
MAALQNAEARSRCLTDGTRPIPTAYSRISMGLSNEGSTLWGAQTRSGLQIACFVMSDRIYAPHTASKSYRTAHGRFTQHLADLLPANALGRRAHADRRGALAMSLVVIRLVARPAAGNLTFGPKRTEVLSAQDGASVDHERAFSSVPRGA